MSKDILHDWWCLYVALSQERPDLAAQVYVCIQELRHRELEQSLEGMEATLVGVQPSNAQ